MRHLFPCLSVAMLVVGSLLLPAVGQAWDRNTLGVFTDTAGEIHHVYYVEYATPITVYILVFDPYNESRDTPIQNLSGLEFSLQVTGGFLIGDHWAVETVDSGEGFENQILQFQEPLPVTDAVALVGTMTILYTSHYESVTFVGPADPAAVPGSMVCRDQAYPEDLCPLDNIYHNLDWGIFCINCFDPTETLSLSAVKALYR